MVSLFRTFDDPKLVVMIGIAYVTSYYFMAIFFNHFNAKPNYLGVLRKNGLFDIVTSIIWCLGAVLLIASLLDLLIHKEIGFRYVLSYYFLFIFVFAFIYNLLEWHYPGMIDGLGGGWKGELQCLIVSIQVFTGGHHTTAKPAEPLAELVAGIQSLLGVLFVAVFIAKAVAFLG